jgi:branched-chain amino acid aminotransferase
MNETSAISIKITRTENSQITRCDFENIQFGTIFSDHMFRADYHNGKWQDAEILPYGDIALAPSLSALHYGQSVFEGMKAFKDQQGNPQLFRPLDNWKRLNLSGERMAMPPVDQDIFMEGLRELVNLDSDWIPTRPGSALYLRPFMFATDDFVGVRPSANFTFMIFTCPVNSYYLKPLKVWAEEKYVRAFDGGTGFAKAAGNYGAAMLPTLLAQRRGYDQIMWTDGHEHQYIEESGTTNLFFVIGDKVVTPMLDGTILDGITRDSCITILRDKGIAVEERKVSLKEILAAHKSGELKEAFGTGTAALIAKISAFAYQETEYALPESGEKSIATMLYNELEGIRTSAIDDRFNWIVKL